MVLVTDPLPLSPLCFASLLLLLLLPLSLPSTFCPPSCCSVVSAALALGMNVVGYDPVLSLEAALTLPGDRMKRVTELDDLFAEADYISLHVPYIKVRMSGVPVHPILFRAEEEEVVVVYTRLKQQQQHISGCMHPRVCVETSFFFLSKRCTCWCCACPPLRLGRDPPPHQL